MKQHDGHSLLNIDSTFSCGFNTPLVKAKGKIQLSNGTHYLLGKNGKGKTTLLRTLAGLRASTSGSFSAPRDQLYIPENLSFDPELPTFAILQALLSRKSYKNAITEAKTIELNTKLTYGKLSTGNKKKVALLLAEHQIPAEREALIMLDEPLSGLDQEVREYFRNKWNQPDSKRIRIVSHHPENEDTLIKSALTISEGLLEHHLGKDLTWADLKTQLN